MWGALVHYLTSKAPAAKGMHADDVSIVSPALATSLLACEYRLLCSLVPAWRHSTGVTTG